MMMDSYEPLARICAFAWMLGLVAVSMMTIQSQSLELELKYIASTVPLAPGLLLGPLLS